MKEKIIFFIATFFIPVIALAHGGEFGIIMVSLMIAFLLSLIIAIVLLKRFSKRISITNQLLRFFVLFIIGIGLLFVSTVILTFLFSRLGIYFSYSVLI